mgnify:CR=1 FL=1
MEWPQPVNVAEVVYYGRTAWFMNECWKDYEVYLDDYEAAERYAAEAISLPGAAWSAAAYIVLAGYTLLPQGELERAGKVLDRGTRMAYEAGTEIWMRTKPE